MKTEQQKKQPTNDTTISFSFLEKDTAMVR